MILQYCIKNCQLRVHFNLYWIYNFILLFQQRSQNKTIYSGFSGITISRNRSYENFSFTVIHFPSGDWLRISVEPTTYPTQVAVVATSIYAQTLESKITCALTTWKKMHIHTGMTLPFFFIYKYWKRWHGGQPVQNLYIISVAGFLYTQVNGKVNTLCHACNSSQHSKGHGVKVI